MAWSSETCPTSGSDIYLWASLSLSNSVVVISHHGASIAETGAEYYDLCTKELVGWSGPEGYGPNFCQGVATEPDICESVPTLCAEVPDAGALALCSCACNLQEAIAAWRTGYIPPPQ